MRSDVRSRAPSARSAQKPTTLNQPRALGAITSSALGWLFMATALAATATLVEAHNGPPFPVVSDRLAGPYRISIWTDPDATDDGSLGGQFWVVIETARRAGTLPPETRADVSITPIDRRGATQTGRTGPVSNDASRQFVALLMDHEGRYAVRATVGGPLGVAQVDAEVEATYDLRPPPIMLGVYLMPFVLVGFLWLKMLVRRRRGPVMKTGPDKSA